MTEMNVSQLGFRLTSQITRHKLLSNMNIQFGESHHSATRCSANKKRKHCFSKWINKRKKQEWSGQLFLFQIDYKAECYCYFGHQCYLIWISIDDFYAFWLVVFTQMNFKLLESVNFRKSLITDFPNFRPCQSYFAKWWLLTIEW